MIIDYAFYLFLALLAIMIALVIGSYWKRSLCRAYFFVIIVLYVVEESMPARYGNFWVSLHSMKIWMAIVMYSNGDFYAELFTLAHAIVIV